MTARIGNRFALSQMASLAMAETRLAARAVPRVLSHLAPIVAWAAAAIGLGAIVGFAAVVLPPMGAIGIVALVAVVLLWVMPEVPLVYPALIRKAFFVTLGTLLCVPDYYMIQVGGLPWISARRIAAFALIAPFLLAVASSSEIRRQIASRARSSSLIVICAAGFFVMATLSIPESPFPPKSLSALVDAIMMWYVPFLAVIYLVRDENDVVLILKVICFCALFNTACGILEFFSHHRFLVDVIPKSMLASMLEDNPALAVLTGDDPLHGGLRGGLFRASSTFIVALSFGEFEIIAIPIGLFFALHRQNLFERSLGWTVVITGLAGIFASGSRGGWVGFLASTAVFIVIWSIRKALIQRASLAPALVGLAGAISFAGAILLILFWHRAHDMVLGGAGQAGSADARWEQWHAALPLIKENPITGRGFVTGGFDIGSSIDSYVISLLVETGVPGLVFFAGVVCLPIWYGVRGYLTDLSQSGALAGALACSFIAFVTYRLVLSERENHSLIFCLLGIVVVLNYEYERRRAKESRDYRAQRRSYLRADGSGLEIA